jgi:tetratricopeptide (TPR) repeat protein
MISSKKIQFAIISIAVYVIMPLYAAEPNEPNKPETELKFVGTDTRARWRIGTSPGRGPIRPEYMVEFYIKSAGYLPQKDSDGTFVKPLQTNIGKSMSLRQKEFLKTSSSYDILSQISPDKPIGYAGIKLFAVTEEDAKKMVQAYIELVNERVKERRNSYKKEINDREQNLAQAKKELPEKEAEFKTIGEEYNALKDKTHPLSSEAEAVDLAKKSITEMDKTLNALDIELAGINERLKAIEKYRNNPVSVRAEVFAKLDVMYVELVVELSGIQAKKAMTEQINMMEQNFLSLFYRYGNLRMDIDNLKDNIEDYPGMIEEFNNRLKTQPDLQLADIYQNTVTIYPVSDN